MMSALRTAAAALAIGSAVGVLLAASAAVASPVGSIDHVESHRGTVRVLFSIDGLPRRTSPDLSSARATVDGTAVDATATSVSARSHLVSRTAILVLDASDSMAGERFAAAKAAALSYVATAPSDVKIGLVTFADSAQTVQTPTTDRAALQSALNSIKLSRQTHLFDGVMAALAAAGKDGQRRLLVLTDGHDTTSTSLTKVTDAVKKSGAQVDLVGINVSPADAKTLSLIAGAGEGTLVNAAEPNALGHLFRSEAAALAGQVLVSFPVPPAKANTNVNLQVSIRAGSTTYSDSAFVNLGNVARQDAIPTLPVPVQHDQPATRSAVLMAGGVGAVGLAILLAAATLLGVFHRETRLTLEARLAGYGGFRERAHPSTAAAPPVTVKESAVEMTAKAIGRGGFEAKLSRKLDAAGVSFKPAEWVLLHTGIAFASGLAGFLLFNGSLLWTLLSLLVGAVVPWVYLGFSASRRIKAFNTQLPDALQLVAGGLRAGLSLAQSLDSIVREGTEPMSSELRRALVETRLGVGLEDALDGVSERMGSKDFEWVVMAIRIQREVGGNLAELMLTVSGTLRERDYLRRQVQALSAEGRLSAWVLGLMPPLFLGYLALTNPKGVRPLFTTGVGLGLLALAIVMMAIGAFWLSRVVKVEA